MTINSAQIQEDVIDVLPSLYAEKSVLASVGTGTLSTNIDSVLWTKSPFPSYIGESAQKVQHTTAFHKKGVIEGKLVYITDPWTYEFEKKRLSQEVLTQMIGDMISNFPVALDAAVIHGVDPATGDVESDLQDLALVPNISSVVYQGAGDFENSLDTALALQLYADGAAIDTTAFSELRGIRNGSGDLRYPGLNIRSPFDFSGVTVAASNVVGTPGDPSVVGKGDTRAVVGDFGNNLKLAATVSRVEYLDNGPFGTAGDDLKRRNERALLVEVWFRGVVRDFDNFTVVAAGTSSTS